jgi:hypothetical protein
VLQQLALLPQQLAALALALSSSFPTTNITTTAALFTSLSTSAAAAAAPPPLLLQLCHPRCQPRRRAFGIVRDIALPIQSVVCLPQHVSVPPRLPQHVTLPARRACPPPAPRSRPPPRPLLRRRRRRHLPPLGGGGVACQQGGKVGVQPQVLFLLHAKLPP